MWKHPKSLELTTPELVPESHEEGQSELAFYEGMHTEPEPDSSERACSERTPNNMHLDLREPPVISPGACRFLSSGHRQRNQV